MKNIMIILGTFLFGTASCASNSAMEIFKSFDEYQITKVEESRVCWATLSATSSNGVPSFFATYKRKDGDRWQVTGYSGKEAKNADDILTIKFDGEPFIIREMQRSNNIFPLPFTEDIDLTGFDNRVEISSKLSFDLIRLKDEIIVDLKGLEIGTSIKISSVKLPESVTPTIVDRDFVIATVAAPTVLKEPEKPAEGETAEVTEGAEGAEGAAAAGTEGATPAAGAGKDGDPAKKDDKAKGKEQATEKKQPEKK